MEAGSSDALYPGLSEQEAATRLKAEGPNAQPEQDRRTPARIVIEILREPMFHYCSRPRRSISSLATSKKPSFSPSLPAPRF
jgi:Cation transporter/ATPase, N-terminus